MNHIPGYTNNNNNKDAENRVYKSAKSVYLIKVDLLRQEVLVHGPLPPDLYTDITQPDTSVAGERETLRSML